MGFDEVFIDMVWRIMANNWYSIIVNGKRHGFFQSTRGLKQGDPLSPALFILGAEVLSRSLNSLHNNPDYYGFFLEPRGPQVNHLSFANDIILFTSGRQKTLQLILQTLKVYEETPGQLINTDQSHLMVHTSAFNSTRDRIKRITGFRQKEGHLTYLGCPLFNYTMANKIIELWWERYFSQACPTISTYSPLISSDPPVTVLNQVQSIMDDFFWGWRNEKKKYHWASWKHLSFPYEEGGIGMRNLKDMMHTKHKVEEHIKWKLNSGNCSFWWDNWLGVGPLAQFSTDGNRFNNTTVADFWVEGQWDLKKLIRQAPNNYLANILSTELYI
ncbi:uncharacterized protein LOC125852491 [Solanum stenotomum]|uniref:uncharacterized protein LOC125852491 n=1 Tax=Solanum stenotomum TaxID=172797 RepID=UPI0020D0F3B5|nr:uncharacterized protein LOC125852491 [Solanum stenotomum]